MEEAIRSFLTASSGWPQAVVIVAVIVGICYLLGIILKGLFKD